MKSSITIITASLAIAFSLTAQAQSSDTSGSNTQQSSQAQSAQRSQQSGWPNTQRASREQCDQLQGNAKTICNAEIKAMKMVQDAKEKVAQHDSPQTRLEFAETRADAKFEVANARCGDLIGDAKKACEDEATAMRDLTKARAKRQALAQAASQSSGSSTSTDTASGPGTASSTDSSSNAGSTAQTDATRPASDVNSGNPQPSRQSQPSQPTSASQ